MCWMVKVMFWIRSRKWADYRAGGETQGWGYGCSWPGSGPTKKNPDPDSQNTINPLNHGGGALYAPPSLFSLYSKLSWGTYTWKFLTLQTFLLRMPLWKRNQKFNFTPLSESTLKYGSENRPWVRGLMIFSWIFFPLCPVFSKKFIQIPLFDV